MSVPAQNTLTTRTHSWGMTELSAMHVGFCGPDYVSKPEAVGPPMPINEIRIVDPETRAVLPTRGFGIIEARGSNMMKGYYNNPKANIETINEDGWLDTGDMGFIDEDGDLWIRDRGEL